MATLTGLKTPLVLYSDADPLLCSGETTSGVLCPVLDLAAQERQETAGEGSIEGYEDDEGTGAFLMGKAEGAGPV